MPWDVSLMASSWVKTDSAWPLGIIDILIMSGSRQRSHFKGPKWIIILVSLVSICLIGAYIYAPRGWTSCYIFSTSDCAILRQFPFVPLRELTDDENAAQVVIKELLNLNPTQTKNPKIAFMFLTPGMLPFEPLWEKFFHVRLRLLFVNSFHFSLFCGVTNVFSL